MKRRDLLKAIGVSSILPFVHIEAQAPQIKPTQAKQPQISADSGDCLFYFSPESAIFSSANPPQLTLMRGQPVIAYDDSVRQTARWVSIATRDFSDKLTVIVELQAAQATSGYVDLDVRLEASRSADIALPAASKSGSVAVPAALGVRRFMAIPLTNAGGIKAGDYFELRVSRNASGISDTAMGDLLLRSVELRKA